MCMQNLRRALLGLSVATLVVVGTAVGGPFEDGVAAYQRGDYAIALQSYRKAADQGDARAQNNLGAMYESGRGVPQSYTEAIRWYRLAADQGYANAQNNLGSMYIYGRGVPQNYAEAMKWYRLAADQGNARAQVNLGIMYGKGQGTPKNYAEAMKWFRLAADRGDAQGQVMLASVIAMVWACRRTIPRQSSGFASRLTKVKPLGNSLSVSCIATVRGYSRTTARQ